MVKGNKFGKMAVFTKATGKRIWLMDLEDCYTQMGMFILENGLKIKLMAEEYTYIITELDMMGNGKKINKKGEELKRGLTELDMKEYMLMEKRRAKVNLNGLMVPNLWEIFHKMTFMDLDYINGATEDNMKENGK